MKIKRPTFKFVGVDGSAVFSEDDAALFFNLTKQQTQLLLQLLPSIHWATRWNPTIEQAIIDEFVSALELALMTPIDVNIPGDGLQVGTLPIGTVFHSLSATCPANCLPLWQNFGANASNPSTHPDFQVLSGNNTMYVLPAEYPDLALAIPDFVQNVGGTDYINLAGFQGKFLLLANPFETLGYDLGDGDISQSTVGHGFAGNREGGAEIHILQNSEIPAKTQTIPLYAGGAANTNNRISFQSTGGAGATTHNHTLPNAGGDGQAHNNMPPYKTTYAYIIAKPSADLFDGVITDENVCDYVDSCLDPVDDNPQNEGYNPENNPAIDSLDCVWGGVSRLIEWLNDDLNTYMDIIDELGDIASAVPVFGIVTSLVSFMGVFTAALTSVVRSGNNQGFRDDLKCWFFCRIKDRGEPYQLLPEDIDAYRAYAWERATVSDACGDIQLFDDICPLGIIDLLDFPTDAAHLAFYYMFTIYPYIQYIKRFALGFSDECNDDWQILCDCAEQYEFRVQSDEADYLETGVMFLEGVTYRVIADGSYERSNSNQDLNDAQFSTNDRWETTNPWSSFNGLYYNGSKLPQKAYDPSHIYIWDIVGDGSEATFKINDSVYNDNDGEIVVSILRIS